MLSVRHEIFLEVAAQLNFSKAAKALFISQPAVSKHMKALELYYKTTLFERKGNEIKLTQAGEILFRFLREARTIEKKLEFELSTLKNQLHAKGQLKLGASTTVALYILPKILSAFHQSFPEVKISLLNRNTDTIVTALLEQSQNTANDNVSSTSGFLGTVIHRDFGAEDKRVTLEIISNSPLLTSVNALLSLPLIANNGDNKMIKIAGYKGLLTKISGDATHPEYELQLPLNSSLITLKAPGYSQDQLIQMANTLPLTQIAKTLQ